MARTVKVRAALVMFAGGRWGIAGWSIDEPDQADEYHERMMEEAYELAEYPAGPHAEHWITAEVEVPEPTEIEGTVEDA